MATSSTPSNDKDDDPIVLNFHNTLLRQSDVSLLNGPHWLNDKILSFYFEYLQDVEYKDVDEVAFVSPEVVQFLKFADESDLKTFFGDMNVRRKKFVLMVVNDSQVFDSPSGTHWSLLVYRTPDTFQHYDSCGNFNERSAREIVRKLSSHICGSSNVEFVGCRCPQQVNCYDCGIHVILNSEVLLQHFVRDDPIEWYDAYNASQRGRSLVKDLISTLK